MLNDIQSMAISMAILLYEDLLSQHGSDYHKLKKKFVLILDGNSEIVAYVFSVF